MIPNLYIRRALYCVGFDLNCVENL